MEFPGFGSHCDYLGCKMLDFLPFECKKCNKSFCSEHFNEHDVTCSKNVQLNENELKTIEDAYKCSHSNCKETSIVPLICAKCNRHFCIAHRHIINCNVDDSTARLAAVEKLKQPVKQFERAKANVDRQIDESLSNVRKKNKNAEMAVKVQLMRIKNKATGSKNVATGDRVYFNVHRKTGESKPVAIFVARTWTVGRAIDAIAEEMRLKNDNNKGDALKLRLFKYESGHIVSSVMSDKIGDLLLRKELIDGENLFMEYVAADCESV